MYLFHSLTAIQRTGQDLPAGSAPFACCNESSVEKDRGKLSVCLSLLILNSGQNEKGHSCKREPAINEDRLNVEDHTTSPPRKKKNAWHVMFCCRISCFEMETPNYE